MNHNFRYNALNHGVFSFNKASEMLNNQGLGLDHSAAFDDITYFADKDLDANEAQRRFLKLNSGINIANMSRVEIYVKLNEFFIEEE